MNPTLTTFSSQLLRAGIHAPAIRQPTVPRGSSRVRVTLSAAHSDEDVAALVAALRAAGAGGRGASAAL